MKHIHIIEVWGDFACFSRPELKVERWSYPCPTPSAARGIFEAIYFKPQFYWQIDRIELLAHPAYIALRRNEVGAVASESNIKSWMKAPGKTSPLMADDLAVRQQRQTMALREPRFRITAHIVPRPGHEHEQPAFDQQFIRRAEQGKCFQQPYLGCREFVAFYRLIRNMASEPAPVNYTQDLGFMLYDVFDLRQTNNRFAPPWITMFRARIEQGVLAVPPFESDAVLKPATPPTRNGRRAG